VPHTLFVVGCGPDDSAVFRVVAFDLSVIFGVAAALGAELGAHHVLVVHSSIQALGPDGSTAMLAEHRLLVRRVMDSGGDYEALPWGFAQRAVLRAFDGRTGQEHPWAWTQAIHEQEAREEVHPRTFAPYAMYGINEDGSVAPRAATGATAEA
jgi:hypothetical protein